jgi:hypothetical protein
MAKSMAETCSLMIIWVLLYHNIKSCDFRLQNTLRLYLCNTFDIVGYKTAAWVACNLVSLCQHHTGGGEVAALMRRTAL